MPNAKSLLLDVTRKERNERFDRIVLPVFFHGSTVKEAQIHIVQAAIQSWNIKNFASRRPVMR
jgi:hypothetical protein